MIPIINTQGTETGRMTVREPHITAVEKRQQPIWAKGSPIQSGADIEGIYSRINGEIFLLTPVSTAQDETEVTCTQVYTDSVMFRAPHMDMDGHIIYADDTVEMNRSYYKVYFDVDAEKFILLGIDEHTMNVGVNELRRSTWVRGGGTRHVFGR